MGWDVKKAVIPVAGMGVRFLPATKTIPKELFPIVDRPTVLYVVEEAYRAGIEQVVFVTASGKHAIEDFFDQSFGLEKFLEARGKQKELELVKQVSNMVEVITVRQKEPKGLGHAIYCARDIVQDEPFCVLLGDDLIDSDVPCIKRMVDVAAKYEKAVIAACRVPRDKVSRYGIMEGKLIEERVVDVSRMVEKPKPEETTSDIAIIGRYVLPPEVFDILRDLPPGKGGEIQLTDALIRLNEEGCGVLGYIFEGIRYDAGDIYGFIEANIAYAMKRPELKAKLLELFKTFGEG